jgi:hypothetical protein
MGEGFEIEGKEIRESLTIEKEEEFHNVLTTCRASRNLYLGEGFELGDDDMFSMYAEQHYDPWEAETDVEGSRFDFHIIGTSADDVDAQPHVLSPPQMCSLQEYLPIAKRGETFWLKYSLVRDGADSTIFLQNLRGSTHTVMAMETVDGEVFGAYTGAPWEIQHGYFGKGESFLWRMKSPRDNTPGSVFEQAKREAAIEAFKYSFENSVAQICQSDRIAVGGGTTSSPREISQGVTVQPNEFGFGICFDNRDLLNASSSPCLTFNSPSLSKIHSDGSKFELLNLEVWTFTPCLSIEEAVC